MIEATLVQFGDKIYGDPSGVVAVYSGSYSPMNPDGQQEYHQVAIKELKIPNDNQSVIGGIVQEIVLQLKLEGCEFVCKCFGYFMIQNKLYIVSELLDHDLDKDMKMRQGNPYPESQLMTWLYKVLTALIFARMKNILLTKPNPTPEIKLVDFGSGAIADGKVQKLTGTPLYMSPEQIPILKEFQRTGKLPDTTINAFKSDVYSLGITFLHLALLEPPVQLLIGDRDSAITSYLGQINPNYPTLSMALYYMLLNDPASRPDFPDIVAYLKDPNNPYVFTVHQKPEMIAMTETPGNEPTPTTASGYNQGQPMAVDWTGNSTSGTPQMPPQPTTRVCDNCKFEYSEEYLKSLFYNQCTYMLCPDCYNQYAQNPQPQPPEDLASSSQSGCDQEGSHQGASAPTKSLDCKNCGNHNDIMVASQGEILIAFCSICYSPAQIAIA